MCDNNGNNICNRCMNDTQFDLFYKGRIVKYMKNNNEIQKIVTWNC